MIQVCIARDSGINCESQTKLSTQPGEKNGKGKWLARVGGEIREIGREVMANGKRKKKKRKKETRLGCAANMQIIDVFIIQL